VCVCYYFRSPLSGLPIAVTAIRDPVYRSPLPDHRLQFTVSQIHAQIWACRFRPRTTILALNINIVDRPDFCYTKKPLRYHLLTISTKMDVTTVYTITFSSTLAVLLTWRLWRFLAKKARKRVLVYMLKWAVYTVVLPRMNGSSDVTVAMAIALALLLAANIVGCVLLVETMAELSLRLAQLFISNMVLLYFGGRSNLVLDRVFRISHTEYYLLHRWIGRISVVQALAHGTIKLVQNSDALKPVEIAASLVTTDINCVCANTGTVILASCYAGFTITHLHSPEDV
jgi:hypothetical protein